MRGLPEPSGPRGREGSLGVTKAEDGSLLIGMFFHRERAEGGLADLLGDGFREDQIRVAFCDADVSGQVILPAKRVRHWRPAAAIGPALGAVFGTIAGVLLLAWGSILGLRTS